MTSKKIIQSDFVVLGSGFGGNSVATVLAKLGYSVVIVDSSQHPKFAIGESTVPETSLTLKFVGEYFNIPEFMDLSTFYRLRDSVGPSSGIKNGFTFLYHNEGCEFDPNHATQTPTLSPPFGPDSHWFRQDVDHYTMWVAQKYGCKAFFNTLISHSEIGSDSCSLYSDQYEFRCKYVIDGSGPGSKLMKDLELRDFKPDFRTRSLGVFSHFQNVHWWDQVCPNMNLPIAPDQSTIHHVFKEGWMWVIPFDNHPFATNSLCSVGLVLNKDHVDKIDGPGDKYFFEFIKKYPSVYEQLKDAMPTRSWGLANNLQYSAKKIFHKNYIALPHTAAFLDPLYSNGLFLTVGAIFKIGAIFEQHFDNSSKVANELAQLSTSLFEKMDIYDRLIRASYNSFGSFDSWNAVYRLWESGTFLGVLSNIQIFMEYKRKKQRSVLLKKLTGTANTPLGLGINEYKSAFNSSINEYLEAKPSSMYEKANDGIYESLKTCGVLPTFFNRHNKEVKSIGLFTLFRAARLVIWGRLFSKNKEIYNISLLYYAREAFAWMLSFTARAFSRLYWDMRAPFATVTSKKAEQKVLSIAKRRTDIERKKTDKAA